MRRKNAHKIKQAGRPMKYLTPTSFRLPVVLTRRLKGYVDSFKPYVKRRVQVVVWALEDFMRRYDSEEKLKAFIEEFEEKKRLRSND